MIELFVLKDGTPFKYFLPDGTVMDDYKGHVDFEPMLGFLDEEIKIVHYPCKELFNHGTGEIEIEIFDDVKTAVDSVPLVFPKSFYNEVNKVV